MAGGRSSRRREGGIELWLAIRRPARRNALASSIASSGAISAEMLACHHRKAAGVAARISVMARRFRRWQARIAGWRRNHLWRRAVVSQRRPLIT